MKLSIESLNHSRLQGSFVIEGTDKEQTKIEIIERILAGTKGIIIIESEKTEVEYWVNFVFEKTEIGFDEIKEQFKSLKKMLK